MATDMMIRLDDAIGWLRAVSGVYPAEIDSRGMAVWDNLKSTMIGCLSYCKAVEVVHCRDCKFSYRNKYCTCEQWKDNGATVTIEADDFCSYGERRCNDG